jgi:thiamine-monophosphate kinase
LIDHLTKNFEINQASTLKGIGDDAVLDFKDKKVVISTDILVEGVHFDFYMPLKHLGYKAVTTTFLIMKSYNKFPSPFLIVFHWRR